MPQYGKKNTLNSVYELCITLISNTVESNTNKKNYRPVSIINIGAKNQTKY